MKKIGYLFFAMVYYLFRWLPMDQRKVVGIMTHDDGEGSNVHIVMEALKKCPQNFSFALITKSETGDVKGCSSWRKIVTFFLIKPYHLARAKYIFLDNIFLPLAYIKVRQGVHLVQLWHGTGTIKKFGQDVNQGSLKKLEYQANQRVTHLIVNSPQMKELYHGAFGVPMDRIHPIGLPKTDELLKRWINTQKLQVNVDKDKLYEAYGIPKEKKLLLYAPTFRDQEVQNPKVMDKLELLIGELPEEYVLGLRLHPHIAKAFDDTKRNSKVIQFSFETDLNGLLLATDLLITDYSSIVFDFCITERPMIFYAYDFKEFSDSGRGFYYDYEAFVPGPVAYKETDLIEIIRRDEFDREKMIKFKHMNYSNLDARGTERLLQLISIKNATH